MYALCVCKGLNVLLCLALVGSPYVSFLGIDTCYIEGYEKREVEKLYGLDPFKEQVSLIVCFGYRGKEQQPRYRISLDDLVEYR